MNGFLKQASDIAEIASNGEPGDDCAIIMDYSGSLRIIDACGWSLPALRAEYAARVVFRVERGRAAVEVEAWDGTNRCVLKRNWLVDSPL